MAAVRTVTLLGRAGALLLGATVAGIEVCSLSRGPIEVLADGLLRPSTAGRLTVDEVLSGGCGVVLVLCSLWLATATTVAVVALLARAYGETSPVLDRALDRLTPALLRAVVTTALGITVATTVAAPAPADDRGPAPTRSGLDGLALPERTVGTAPGPLGRAVPGRRPTVVVHTGDSLWGIAASLAPPDVSDATLTRAWQRLYRVNATRIGPDPDLILPGTRLQLPGPTADRRRDQP